MKCKRCKNQTYHDRLCRSCFLRYFEKKVRKEIRVNRPIKKNETLIITDALCEYIIKRIIKNLPVKINKKGKGTKVIPWIAEDECHHFLSSFLANRTLKGLGHGDDIKLFLSMREDEVAAYARAKKLKFTKRRKDTIMKVLDELEKKHPQTKYSLLKSITDIKDAINTI